jgi:hypothetical protein
MGSIVDNATVAAKGKEANYSAEVTEKLLAAWEISGKGKADVESLAVTFGKTARSIVAKLSREKVYVKASYVTKAGEKPVSKDAHVANIALMLGIDPSKLESLEKANKAVLTILEDALNGSAELFDAIVDTVEPVTE